ncbi:LysR family transcriptional regulator, partial [Turicibacter sanguinis]|nr:LysR family transcriptional regulator [Turicibacter sanguinis]MTN16437.1 LysR family transcriptional regulator [Turicibacter sanguinis]
MIEEFKTFIAVVEHQNFTKAGESINLSQPTVSTHIKNLEIYFNTTLIN